MGTSLTLADERCRDAHAKMVAKYISLRDHIVKHLGCRNCGEPAGYECRHDFGCTDADRTVPPDEMARGAPAEGRKHLSLVQELTPR